MNENNNFSHYKPPRTEKQIRDSPPYCVGMKFACGRHCDCHRCDDWCLGPTFKRAGQEYPNLESGRPRLFPQRTKPSQPFPSWVRDWEYPSFHGDSRPMYLSGGGLLYKRQRGSEELVSPTGMVAANGGIMSPTQTMELNDAKKVKLDQAQAPPSKVLHIRNIPQEAQEADILAMAIPFGKPTNLVRPKNKTQTYSFQALLEMESIQAATAMRDYYNMHPLSLQGQTKPLAVQFSNHQELKTEDTPQNNLVKVLLRITSDVIDDENRKTVLRVIVEHVVYPITVDILRDVFKKYGYVQKIITFSKNNKFQALVQMSNAVSARFVKEELNGKNIYSNCCTLSIDYSKMNSLNVRYNNDKSRDYTNNTLPPGDGMIDGTLAAYGSPQSMLAGPGFAVPGYGSAPLTAFGTAGGTPLLQSQNILPNAAAAAASLGALQGRYSEAELSYLGQFPGLFHPTAIGAAGVHMPAHAHQTPVLLVSNLHEQKITPDALFTLFGVYGDVQRVKIIYNKKDNALVQFADISQANTAMLHLNDKVVYGKPLKITGSKYSVVQMPKEGSQDAGAELTKDYVNSPLHRFRKPNSKNFLNICPPSGTLHLSNIPPETTEEDLKQSFQRLGANVVDFRFFQKDRKMALIKMASIDDAIVALMHMHNYKLSESNHLRVSFSKTSL